MCGPGVGVGAGGGTGDPGAFGATGGYEGSNVGNFGGAGDPSGPADQPFAESYGQTIPSLSEGQHGVPSGSLAATPLPFEIGKATTTVPTTNQEGKPLGDLAGNWGGNTNPPASMPGSTTVGTQGLTLGDVAEDLAAMLVGFASPFPSIGPLNTGNLVSAMVSSARGAGQPPGDIGAAMGAGAGAGGIGGPGADYPTDQFSPPGGGGFSPAGGPGQGQNATPANILPGLANISLRDLIARIGAKGSAQLAPNPQWYIEGLVPEQTTTMSELNALPTEMTNALENVLKRKEPNKNRYRPIGVAGAQGRG